MTTMLAVLTTSARRDYIEQAVTSAQENLKGDIGARVIFTDPDLAYGRWLQDRFPDFAVLSCGPRQGYGPAMRSAWATIVKLDVDDDHVFWLEDDFVFQRPVDVDAMTAVLQRHPELVQLALRRQPWNDDEIAAGGVVELHPHWFTDRRDDELDADWLEQSAWWTDNPSLFRRSLCAIGWPEGEGSEGMFSFVVKDRHGDVRFGYWGARDSGEAVAHIGERSAR